jgi:hypothetical protein
MSFGLLVGSPTSALFGTKSSLTDSYGTVTNLSPNGWRQSSCGQAKRERCGRGPGFRSRAVYLAKTSTRVEYSSVAFGTLVGI